MLARIALLTGSLLATGADPKYWDPVIADVTLEDPSSGKAFVMRHSPEAYQPDDDFPQFRLLSSEGTEVLVLLQHHGAERYGFGQFRVRRSSSVEGKRLKKGSLQHFVSGKGVRLGLTIEQLVVLLGAGQRDDGKGVVSLRYSCSSGQTCPGLQQVNMPAYEAIYRFQRGTLVEFEAGYPYP
jgi:hypothetical protein